MVGLLHNKHYNKDQRLDRTGRLESRRVGLGYVGIWTEDRTGPEIDGVRTRDWTGQADQRLEW